MVTQAAFEHYKLGIPTIDVEHWMLISTMAEVNRLVVNKQLDDARALLINLKDQLKNHCASEEQFMKDINYPYTPYHVTAHAAIITKMDKAIKELESSYADYVMKSFTNTLHDVFVAHIDSYDMQIAAYVQKQKAEGKL